MNAENRQYGILKKLRFQNKKTLKLSSGKHPKADLLFKKNIKKSLYRA
jgi:hypothetical protein